jgi:anti-sigma regulatory factor (Ser/Thr protein kinase)
MTRAARDVHSRRRQKVSKNGKNDDIIEDEKTNVIDELTRPAEIESVPQFLRFAAAIERAEGFDDERIKEIETALKEALTMIVKNGEKNPGGDIVLTCKRDPWGKLMIVISDTGEPFNILLADVVFFGEKEPVDPTRRDSARLIKRLIDNVEQKRVDNTNMLTFTVVPRLRSKQ